MKQFYLVIFLITSIFLPSSFAIPVHPNMVKEEVTPTVNFKNETFTVKEFKLLTPKQFKQKTGKRLTLKDRVLLTFLKKSTDEDGKLKIHWGAFALGFFLSLIGLVITLFFKDKDAWKSALIGIGAIVLISLLAGVLSA